MEDRLSQACSVLATAPNDPARTESGFLDSVQMIAKLVPRPSSGTAVSICVVAHVDCQLETLLRFCVGHFREKVGIDELC